MIEFFNIRTGERTKLDNPHHIASYINSSDMHVNAGQGQDFGWRISAFDVARINKLKSDPSRLEDIARHLGKPVGEIKQVDFVKYVSYLDDLEQQTKMSNESEVPAFQAQYEAELKAIQNADVPIPSQDVATVTMDSPTEPAQAPETPELPVAPVKSSTPAAKKK